MKKILIVFGTRPEAIKMAPLIHALKQSDRYEVKILITAQHRQMLDQILTFFKIKPDLDLDIMKPNQDLTDITVKILEGCKKVFSEYKPDLTLVHGDTTTTMAASLAAFYQGIPIGHVEAGLRTYNLAAPFPEELNRQITTKLTRFHFAPTEKSKNNLVLEGVQEKNILVSGNTVIDALFEALKAVDEKQMKQEIRYSFSERPFILITGHRRENFGSGFVNICEAIKALALKYPGFDFIYPVHLNPNVKDPVHKILSNLKNVFLLEPLDYLPFVFMMSKSYLILTDSGGVQEEAPSLGKPVLVMRETTERPEAVEAGTVKLVGTSQKKIISEVSLLIDSPEEYQRMQKAHNPYGDGHACKRIVKFLDENL